MGQIQTSQMELEAFCARLAPVFLEYLRTHGTAIDRIEVATSLDGITTLPARYSLGGVEKNVLAPLKLLTKDVDIQIEVCRQVTLKANVAAENATAAAVKATESAAELDEIKTATVDATAKAEAAADRADTSRQRIEANEAIREVNEATRQTNEQARQSKLTELNAAIDAATEAKGACEVATTKADAAAESAREASIAAAQSVIEWTSEANTRVDMAIARIEANNDAAMRDVATATDLANAAADRANEAANRANAATDKLGIPQTMVVDVPGPITFGNQVEQRIKATLKPEDDGNVLFLPAGGDSVSVMPDGRIVPLKAGLTRVYVIPVHNVELYQMVEIVVNTPGMRLTSGGTIRINDAGRGIRIK